LIAHADAVSDQPTPVTATCCVGEWRSNGQPLADALRDAQRTLVHAKTMGGSTICNTGDFDAEFAAWTQASVQSGVALAQLQASDVMTPFALTLSNNPDSEILAQALNSGVASIAQIDNDGKYAGLFDFGALGNNRLEQAGGSPAPPSAVAEDASFAELIE
jgi:hypothetical protein